MRRRWNFLVLFGELDMNMLTKIRVRCFRWKAQVCWLLPAVMIASDAVAAYLEIGSSADLERPQLRFTARRGWSNDPCGLSYYRGEYHLFFQHCPGSRSPGNWRNQHWGHAVSTNLIHWRELGTVLTPDSLGSVYSGSAVVDRMGSAGFGTNAHVLVYTAANHAKNDYTQCLAWSLDGRRYEKFAGNPVLPQVAFENRDPKVFWHAPTGRWIMFLYAIRNARQAFRVFSSADLRHWEEESCQEGDPFSGRFDPGHRYLYECPECVELKVEGEDAKRWVIWGASGMYSVGQFDGTAFKPEEERVWFEPELMGRRYYAAQTFSAMPDGRTVLMAWLTLSTTNAPFTQGLSIPQELGLRRTEEGLRLTRRPVAEYAALRDGGAKAPQDFEGELLEAHVSGLPQSGRRTVLNFRGVEIVYDPDVYALSAGGETVRWPLRKGERLDLVIYLDRLGMEVFSGDGLHYAPFNAVRPDPVNRRAECPRGLKDVQCEVYRLNSVLRRR